MKRCTKLAVTADMAQLTPADLARAAVILKLRIIESSDPLRIVSI
jgi:hypothetical protein